MNNSSLKRHFNLFDENHDDLRIESMKKQKTGILRPTNNTGLLSPPVTPEHVMKATMLNVDSLKPVSKNLCAKLSLPTKLVSPYTTAKNLFHRCSIPYTKSKFCLSGREKESRLLNDHIVDSLQGLYSSSIYISGPPGTGKSAQTNASLNYILEHSKLIEPEKNLYHLSQIGDQFIDRKIRVIKFNCMTLSNPSDLLKRLYTSITGKKCERSIESSEILRLFNSSLDGCDMTILILDEMDNIVSKSQQPLFELFTSASNRFDGNQKSKLLLIGIANALNLTDRFLPRLRANCINPTLIQFLPYTADQIKSVITEKLMTLVPHGKENKSMPPLVHPAAIQFCAKKSAATTGDLRRAFDIMYASIDLFEQSQIQKVQLVELVKQDIENLPKVMITQVVKVCSNSFNANFEMKLKPLTIQQKLLLAFLFKFEEMVETETSRRKAGFLKSTNETSLNAFFAYYTEKCKNHEHINSLKRSEFLEIITALDIQGLVLINTIGASSSIKASPSNTISSLNFDNHKVTSNLPKSEFFKNVTDVPILKKIIYTSY